MISCLIAIRISLGRLYKTVYLLWLFLKRSGCSRFSLCPRANCQIRGYVFYNGQPKECRKCGSLDHIAANCELEICRHCKSKEHGSKDSQLPKKCNLCGAESHRYRDCPHAYSNKTKQQNHGETENVVDFEDLASTTGDLASTGNQQLFTQDGRVPLEIGGLRSRSPLN
uniref:CCHC-type domain-containing protein n=1 Tax=Sinocyclocheilus grahami TaxID=75366 RepID=A0A672LXE5_SINGR